MYQAWCEAMAAGREPTGADLARAAGRTNDATGIGRRAAHRYRDAHTATADTASHPGEAGPSSPDTAAATAATPSLRSRPRPTHARPTDHHPAPGHPLQINAVLLGEWPRGDTLTVQPDGHTTGGDAQRLAVLDLPTTLQLLQVLCEAHTGQPTNAALIDTTPADIAAPAPQPRPSRDRGTSRNRRRSRCRGHDGWAIPVA